MDPQTPNTQALQAQQPLAFEQEPDWDSLPDLIPSTTVADILKINRKTLTKYVQIGKFAPPAERGASSAHYRKADVIGYWRMRQVRIADGSIKVEADPNSEWGKANARWDVEEAGYVAPWTEGGTAVDVPSEDVAEMIGPIPGGGVDSLPEPRAGEADLVSLSRGDFEAMLTRLWQQAQAPLVAQLKASETLIGELVESQGALVTAQREFLAQQATAQGQQAEAWRLVMEEQRRLSREVAQLTQQLQTRAQQEEAARLRAEAEPANAWERFLRTLNIRVR